jgi:hypothetical protein
LNEETRVGFTHKQQIFFFSTASIPGSGTSALLCINWMHGSQEIVASVCRAVVIFLVDKVDKRRPARKADLSAICEPVIKKVWEPRRFTTLWASTACYITYRYV